MKKVIFSISTLILSGALTACTNHSASEVANQTDTVVTTTSVVSNKTTQPSENTVTTSITNDNLTTQLLHNEIPPFLKGASRDEIIQSKGNLKYRTDREGELLVYDNVGYIGTDDIDTLAYAPMLCYFFRDNLLVKEQYYLNAETSTVDGLKAVSYTHLRAHETVLDLVCRLLLEKKNKIISHNQLTHLLSP